MATSGGGNHCDVCFILDKIKVNSSSMCRECRHQLCDGCVEHHRRTLATRDHMIISFQHTDTSTKEVYEQNPNRPHRIGTKPKTDLITTSSTQVTEQQSEQRGTKVKSVALTNVTKSCIRTDKQSLVEVSGRREQHDTRNPGNTADTQSHVSSTQNNSEKPKYEVSGRRVTGSDTADQDGAVTSSMKNMRLDAGTSNTQTTRQTGKLYTTATLKHSLDVNDKYNCWISGLVLLQDKLILCDRGNSKLKVYDSSYRFLHEYKGDDTPRDIDVLDVNTVVVSSDCCRNLRLLSVGNDSMKEIYKINTEYTCKGVCCYEGKIYCSLSYIKYFKWFSEVRVYTLIGELLYKFEHLSDGKVECNNLDYITVNPQTSILYVTDRDKDVVLALSTSGDVIAVMSLPQLEYPQGIACDNYGHIYVCGWGSDNVIQMTPDGCNVLEILSGKEMCKEPVCEKIYGNEMFVSHRDPKSHNDKISIYQLS